MHTINGWINIEGFRELLVISFDDEAAMKYTKQFSRFPNGCRLYCLSLSPFITRFLSFSSPSISADCLAIPISHVHTYFLS